MSARHLGNGVFDGACVAVAVLVGAWVGDGGCVGKDVWMGSAPGVIVGCWARMTGVLLGVLVGDEVAVLLSNKAEIGDAVALGRIRRVSWLSLKSK